MSKYKLYLQYFAEGATAGGEGDSGEGTVDVAQVSILANRNPKNQ
ncbi:MAG: hypothetical protein ACLUR5_06660 [Eubacterium ventriosum]